MDDGGVISDNSRKGEQWGNLIAEYFVPRYGGIPEEWKETNQQVVRILMKKIDHINENEINLDHDKYIEFENKTKIEYMFDAVGIKRPPKKEYDEICREVDEWLAPKLKAEIKGIKEVVKSLKGEGYTLHTASGHTSWVLRGILSGMGIIDCFTNLYGPDIVEIMKGGSEFYRRIFNHSEVKPSDAIVIDDNPKMLQLAGQLGASTIQSCVIKEIKPKNKYYYNDPEELIEIIREIASVKRKNREGEE
jgi:FMN phosphatase YigB (HAD superfamily)